MTNPGASCLGCKTIAVDWRPGVGGAPSSRSYLPEGGTQGRAAMHGTEHGVREWPGLR